MKAKSAGARVGSGGGPRLGSGGATPAMRSSLHRSVAQDIGARILNGEFAPGTLLPNEAEWCASFGVSRTAVREAIKMLMAKGLILSRPKIGSRVQPRAAWNLLDRDVLTWYCAAANPTHFLVHMQQVREILEPETAALAATNRTEEQMAEIQDALARMGAVVTGKGEGADVVPPLTIGPIAGSTPASTTVPSAMASCGIHSGVASLAVEMSWKE